MKTKERTLKIRNQRLYLGEMTSYDEGSSVFRGVFARNPRAAVNKLRRIFLEKDGWNVWVMQLKLVNQPTGQNNPVGLAQGEKK